MADEIETHWQRLQLDTLGASPLVTATFTADALGRTVQSDPAATPKAAPSALPRLTMAPPAVNLPGVDLSSELVALRVLGEGGMGQVLVARQTALGREVAVKLLKDGASGGAASLVAEARITGALEHPNIVPVYALASSDTGSPAVVMKRVDGVSWQELLVDLSHPGWKRLLRNGSDRLEANVRLLMQVCDALGFAHRRGVVHRDLKPANVLIGEWGEVYLADWGVAFQRLPEGSPEPTPQLVGTPAYMAPEMVLGDARKIDERTDVYLLGATLSEVLLGHAPHQVGELRAALQHALESTPLSDSTAAEPELVRACQRAMAKNPGARFASAADFRQALTDFLTHRGSAALSAAAHQRLAELRAAVAASGQPTQPRSAWTVFAECRFGFTQALDAWKENAAARAGLTEALKVMAHFEIAQGHLSAATALAEELAPAPEELTQALAALAARLEAERAEHGRMLKREYDLDIRVSFSQRRAFTAGLAAICLTFGVMMLAFRPLVSAYQPDHDLLLASSAFITLLIGAAAWLGRKALLVNEINRRSAGFFILTALAVTIHRAFGWALLSPIPSMISGDIMICAGMLSFAAISLHRSLAWSALIMLLAAGLSAAFPLNAYNFLGLGVAAAMFTAAGVMVRPAAPPRG